LAAIEVHDVTRRYGAVTAVEQLSLSVEDGGIVAVVGPSGCGKTTLLELVCRLQAPDAGRIVSPPATLMPQRDALLPWLSAEDNAALPLRIAGTPRDKARTQVRPYFEPFGLAGFERARPGALSGGMRQRVAFLRTLMAGTPVLCLDEPFGALDALTRVQMQEWLAATLEREPRTVLLVTHDVEEAAVLADRVVILSPRPGRVVATIDVPAPRPRRRTDPEVVEVVAAGLEALGLEREVRA
jgi:NitT/TauT family transport system ATP-binding protein